jgi:hypothetical protein
MPQDALEAEIVGVADLEAQVGRLTTALDASEQDRRTLRQSLTDMIIDRDRERAARIAAEERCRELCGGGAYT